MSERKSKSSSGVSFKILKLSLSPARSSITTSSPCGRRISIALDPNFCRIVSSRESVSAISSIPIEGTLLPHVDVADRQNTEKNSHLYQAKDSQLTKVDRPRVEKYDFEIEDQKQHCDQVKFH